jgi:hypothetical protein
MSFAVMKFSEELPTTKVQLKCKSNLSKLILYDAIAADDEDEMQYALDTLLCFAINAGN